MPVAVVVAGFGLLGVLAAGPVSAALARARWPARSPTVALVLWQSVCLCAGLSLTGAVVVLAVAPLGHHLPAALGALVGNLFDGAPLRGLAWWRIVLLAIGVVFAAGLLATVVRCFVLVLRRRRAHRDLLDLLAVPADDHPPTAVPDGVRVLDHAVPAAYGVPGWHTRLVLTAGLVDLLTPEQLAAVIAHERAHLRAHHDLLLLPFQAWTTALGPVPGVRAAGRAVAALAEMQADDAAAREVGGATVASALAAVVLAPGASAEIRGEPGVIGPAGPTDGLSPIGGSAVVQRVTRLRSPRPLRPIAVIGVALSALALLLAPTVVLFVGWR